MNTHVVKIGSRKIGGNNPVLVQSMCNTRTEDARSTVKQIHALEDAGCEIIRVAVPHEKAAHALRKIKDNISIPLVADIHFDPRMALLAAPYCDKLRINPGTISRKHVKKILAAAQEYGIPIRIGINLGSIERVAVRRFGRTAEAMVESALEHTQFCEKHNFENVVVSLKASDVATTIEANRIFSRQAQYPIHLGVTEAGTLYMGTIKSAIGIGALLAEGIGNTIRISLTDNPLEEVKAGHAILRALGLRKSRTLISCPTCGRTHGDLISIAKAVEERTQHIKEPITIAVMGCEVNGPGEARHADIGLALSPHHGVIFKKGKVMKRVSTKHVVEEFVKEVYNYHRGLPGCEFPVSEW